MSATAGASQFWLNRKDAHSFNVFVCPYLPIYHLYFCKRAERMLINARAERMPICSMSVWSQIGAVPLFVILERQNHTMSEYGSCL
jgi:hypothetical protein